MSRTRSIVAGGTAAVLLLGIGTSILFAGPPRTSGEIGGPVIVTAAPGTDPPPAGAPAESAAVQAPSAGPAAQAAHEGALSALPDASPTAHDTPVSARAGPRPRVAPRPPAAAPAATDAQPAGRRLAATAARRDETRTTVPAGRSGAREPWPARITTPHRADACRPHR